MTSGSATNSVGAHAPSDLGPGLVNYAGQNQITIEKVRRMYASDGALLTYCRALAQIPIQSHTDRYAHDLETLLAFLLSTRVPWQIL